VGILLWIGSGSLAFLLARIIPHGRSRGWIGELAASILVAFLLGVVATTLDFGGWKELDWRASVFAFCGAFAAAGLVRVLTMRGATMTP
jgi:uncharacterized membrane protein YeaQ/YmgE (transglycosylase-associated protein family)